MQLIFDKLRYSQYWTKLTTNTNQYFEYSNILPIDKFALKGKGRQNNDQHNICRKNDHKIMSLLYTNQPIQMVLTMPIIS